MRLINITWGQRLLSVTNRYEKGGGNSLLSVTKLWVDSKLSHKIKGGQHRNIPQVGSSQ